jgi:hypothetical protein
MGGWLFLFSGDYMANIEHVNIPDGQRHEPAHASTAAAGTFNVANGDGTTQYRNILWTDINSVPGNVGYIEILKGNAVSTTQAPSATATAIQIEFGAAQSFAQVALTSTGTLTFNTAGQYLVHNSFYVTETATTGNAYVLLRAMYNGTQQGNSIITTLNDNTMLIPVKTLMVVNASAGDTLYWQLCRDSTGANAGGLSSFSPGTSGWASCPSATMSVSYYEG